MVNINKLRGRMVEKNLNMDQLATVLGLNRSTLYRKMNNNGDTFTVKEANIICETLQLTSDEAMAIFFKHYVA